MAGRPSRRLLAAPVAVRTVYAIFKNKRGILAATCRAGINNEGSQIYQEAFAQPDGIRRFELVAHATRRRNGKRDLGALAAIL